MLVFWIWVYGDIVSSPYYRRSSTWLNNVSIEAYVSYCIDLVFCYRLISWIGEIFSYIKIKYWMIMKRVPVNWPVVLFLMTVISSASIASTSFWISARSTPLVSLNIHRFFLYWRFSSSWSCRVASIRILRFNVWN